jgi:membrane protease YdiL (CAAX protease family)
MTDPPPARHILFLAVVFEGGLIVVAVVLGWLLNRPSLDLIEPSWRGVLTGLAATIPLVPPMLWCARTSWGPIRKMMAEVDTVIAPFFARSSVLELAVIAILAGLGEELLFRGLIQNGLADLTGTAIALLAASLAFGLLHMITPMYASLASLVGLYLGGLLLLTGDLVVPIVTHVAYDMVALSYVRQRWRKGDEVAGNRSKAIK